MHADERTLFHAASFLPPDFLAPLYVVALGVMLKLQDYEKIVAFFPPDFCCSFSP